MAWTLSQIRQKTNECKRKVYEFEKLASETNDEEERDFYISILESYKQLVKKGNDFIDKQIGKFEILA